VASHSLSLSVCEWMDAWGHGTQEQSDTDASSVIGSGDFISLQVGGLKVRYRHEAVVFLGHFLLNEGVMPAIDFPG
jgi:hypothetical protein